MDAGGKRGAQSECTSDAPDPGGNTMRISARNGIGFLN